MSSRCKVKKGWFYWKNPATRQGYFLAFANQHCSCSMRIFDETSGACIQPADIKHGRDHKGFIGYEKAFAGYLKSAVELHVRQQPNLVEASKNGLPSEILSELQQQIP